MKKIDIKKLSSIKPITLKSKANLTSKQNINAFKLIKVNIFISLSLQQDISLAADKENLNPNTKLNVARPKSKRFNLRENSKPMTLK